jgi:CRISPR-associated protein Csd2
MSFDKRAEFVLLFDVTDGNPNGDPDAGNAPRVDPETGYGFVTDVCLKRKIRNFVAITKGYEPPNDIFVKDRGILAVEQRKAYRAINAEPDGRGSNEMARRWMCSNYFDVRTFGAVMSTGKVAPDDLPKADEVKPKSRIARRETKLWNCGQVRGPVQVAFGRSQSKILSIENAITRVALTNADDTGRSTGEEDEKAATGQFGRKHTVPYALYRAHGFVSPFLARDTGFSHTDYQLLLEAITQMFEHDRAAARGEMSVRGFGIFEHDSALGNAPAHELFRLIAVNGPETPRSFTEYSVSREVKPPVGVSFRWIVAPGH